MRIKLIDIKYKSMELLRMVRDGNDYKASLDSICRYYELETYDKSRIEREYQNLFKKG